MSETGCNSGSLHSGKSSETQALLLRNERESMRTTTRTSRDAHGGCLLTQSPLSDRQDLLASQTRADSPFTRVYEPRPRITCVDRQVIRSFFHPYDAEGLTRRKKGAEHGKGAIGRRNWDGGLLPATLERRLSTLPAGYFRMLRGSAVLLVEDRSQKVIDVIRGVRHG